MQPQYQTYGNNSPWVPGPPQQPAQAPQSPQFFVPPQGAAAPGGGMGGGGAAAAGGLGSGMGMGGGMSSGMGMSGGMDGAGMGGGGMGMGGGMAMGGGLPQTGAGASGMGGGGDAFGGMDPFLTGVAGNMLRQQGQSYLQRGQAFMQSKMGFLSGSSLHYHFSITPEYVRSKLLMLAAPFLKRWHYARVAEQITGGHKYLPPRQDVNAPDLYIPVMAVWTYGVLIGVATLMRSGPVSQFRPDTIYNAVSSSATAWLLHTLLLKVILYLLGIPGAVPLLELAAYAGYVFVPACAALLVQFVPGGGGTLYHAVWAYGSLCMGIFLVRTMKRVIFQEARTYSIDSTRHNYLLLGLAIFQFPLIAWLARLPPLPPAAAGAAAAAAGLGGKAAAAGRAVRGGAVSGGEVVP